MTQLNKILVAYDGSPHGKEALDWAIELSLLSDASVVAVKVVEPLSVSQDYYSMFEADVGASMKEQLNEKTERDRLLLEDAIHRGQQRGVTITTERLHGNIAATIIDYAKDKNVDLIIVGTKGHGVLKDLLMGSVTRNLVSLAHIPVLVVKD